jgi:hypothetical protein
MLVPAEELRALAEGILCANGVPPAWSTTIRASWTWTP